jgi:diguanylate cyclase (GGDEF)-like protein
MKFVKYISAFSNTFLILLSLIMVILIGFIRYMTGPEFAFSLFYLFPIIIVSWNLGRWAGIFISFSSALSWLAADLTMLNKFSNAMVPYINETFRLIVFITIVNIVFELKCALENHKKLARTDPLTDISNRLGFYELATMEINKARRYKRSISMMYIDIDDFKIVNDTYGHHKGDALLCAVAKTIRQHIRVIDIVTRFGGDEFGVLLSETGAESAAQVVKKLKKKVLEHVRDNGCPVTLSIGVATFISPPVRIDEMIDAADSQMYLAKQNGKNRTRYKIIAEENKTFSPLETASYGFFNHGTDGLEFPND